MASKLDWVAKYFPTIPQDDFITEEVLTVAAKNDPQGLVRLKDDESILMRRKDYDILREPPKKRKK